MKIILEDLDKVPLNTKDFDKKTWPDYSGPLYQELKTVVELIKNLVPIIQAGGGGSIIYKTKVDLSNFNNPSEFLVTKAAILGFIKAAQKEYSGYGVDIIYSNPNFIN